MTRSLSWSLSSHGHQKSFAVPPSTTSRATLRTRTRLPSIAAAVGIALVSACSPYDDPARWEPDEIVDGVPAIDWPLGAPNMSDEWVAALYKADAAHVAAQNAHDFSNPALKELVEDDHLMLLARRARSVAYSLGNGRDRSDYRYAPGPNLMKVMSVDSAGDEATVFTCEFAPTALLHWHWYSTEPMTLDDVLTLKTGNPMWHRLERDTSGHIRVTDAGASWSYENPGACDLSGVRPGFFDPAPPFGQEVWGGDFLGPDGVPIPDLKGRMHDGTWINERTGEVRIDPETGEPWIF